MTTKGTEEMAFGKNFSSEDFRGIKPEDWKGDNPFEKGKENITDQMCIIKLNPKLAEFLKKAAGIKLNFPDYAGQNPFMASTLSRSEQAKLQATNPELAKLLEAQAKGARIERLPGGKYYEVSE
jgi:hypothetical protein